MWLIWCNTKYWYVFVIGVKNLTLRMQVILDVYFVSCVSACAGVGGHAGGIPFEVWCRFYYPNVRDQVIAKVCGLSCYIQFLSKFLAHSEQTVVFYSLKYIVILSTVV